MAKQRQKKDYSHITEDLIEHLDWIQSTIDGLNITTTGVQQQISAMLQRQIANFEIKSGAFVPSQDLRSRLLNIEEKFENILGGKVYTNAVKDYLSTFTTIADKNAILHNDYNDLEVNKSLLNPARQTVYDQAKQALYGSGIRQVYQEPIKHMLLQQVTTGGTISDMERIIERWNTGDLSGSKSPTGKPIPSLNQYATQLARDTSYQFNGTVNEIIKDEYGLEGFRYVGDIIKDSRPLCEYLVNLRRDISEKDLAELLSRSDLKPGRIPGTTVKNFCTYRGGYSCRHQAFPVRMERAAEEKPQSQSRGTFSQNDIDALREKNVKITVNGKENDARAIQIINNKIPNFNPVSLIDKFDEAAAQHGVKWIDRAFKLNADPGDNGDFMYFENKGSYEGRPVTMSRRFYQKDGKPFGVYHSLFTIPMDLQGKNFSKELFSSLLEEYKNMGLKEITVTANIDVGGYAWAKYGFDAVSVEQVAGILNDVGRRITEGGGKYTVYDSKGGKSTITQKEYNRIEKLVLNHYDKYPDKPFPMNTLSRRKSGKALLLESYWSGVLDMTSKRKLRIFEDYLKGR